MSPLSAIVQVPLAMQLLAFTVLMQFIAIIAILWRSIFGLPQLSPHRPHWPLIPLVLGTATGVWYAVMQSDLVFGAAQGLALFIGFRLVNSTRGVSPGQAPIRTPHNDKREKRAARRKEQNGGK
jgi:hypothetical protein